MSLTINQAKNAIITQFEADWASATPIAKDNQDFTPPINTDSWVFLSIQVTGGGQITLGGTTAVHRHTGFVYVKVNTPKGESTYANDLLCQNAENVFAGKHISDVWFRNVRTMYVGIIDKWFVQTVVAEMQFDEIK